VRDVGILLWVSNVVELDIDKVRLFAGGSPITIPMLVGIWFSDNPSSRDDAARVVACPEEENFVLELRFLGACPPTVNNRA
jgi:hypothetical protein